MCNSAKGDEEGKEDSIVSGREWKCMKEKVWCEGRVTMSGLWKGKGMHGERNKNGPSVYKG